MLGLAQFRADENIVGETRTFSGIPYYDLIKRGKKFECRDVMWCWILLRRGYNS